MAISSSQARALRLTLFLLGAGFFIFKLIPSWFGGSQQAWDGLNDVFNETLGVLFHALDIACRNAHIYLGPTYLRC